MSDIDNTYSSYSGEGFSIIYESLYMKADFIKDSTFKIIFNNRGYGNSDYQYNNVQLFELKIDIYKPGGEDMFKFETCNSGKNSNETPFLYRCYFRDYIVENTKIKIGYSEGILLYQKNNENPVYGYLVIEENKISIVSEDGDDNFSIYNTNSTVENYGILYFKYDYSGSKSDINNSHDNRFKVYWYQSLLIS